ncbi:MAG: four helix bundle protein [Candidatus Diapherotrites archaeon]
MQDFKKLKLWQESKELVLDIYEATKKFPKTEQYGMAQQMRRAAYSISSNIAEGTGKNSQKEFARFLYMANGSAKEVENFLILARDLGYLGKDSFKELNEKIERIGKMNYRLIQTIQIRK